MSVIHEALQNVESYFSDGDNQNSNSHINKKNDLYKVNKFTFSLHNGVFFVLAIGGMLSLAYIIYSELYRQPHTMAEGFADNTSYTNEDDSIGDIALLDLGDIDVDFVNADISSMEDSAIGIALDEISENFNAEPEEASGKLTKIKQNIDAIRGDIVESNTYIIDNPPAANSVSDDEFMDNQDDGVYELSNDTLVDNVEEGNIVAEKSKQESDYYDLQMQAYQHIVDKDFVNARPVLEQLLLVDSNDYYANINMVLIDIEEARFSQAYKRLQSLKRVYPLQSRIQELLNIIKGSNYG